jgi:hypothetical protein
MRIRAWAAALLTVIGSVSASQPGRANMIIFTTPTGSTTSGGSVSAEADVTTGAGTVTVTLKNLTVDPTSVAQNLSALTLAFNNAVGANSLSSSSSSERTVNGDGTFSDGPTVATGWVESSTTSTLKVDDLGAGGAGPAHTLLGAPGPGGTYSTGGSIAGNGPHNPFLNQTATFMFSAAGVTANTNVTGATFQFGTKDGSDTVGSNRAAVPEPSVLALSALSLFAFGTVTGLRRRVHRKAA